MEVNGVHQQFGYRHSFKYFLLCSAEKRNSEFGFFWWISLTRRRSSRGTQKWQIFFIYLIFLGDFLVLHYSIFIMYLFVNVNVFSCLYF